jgi:hypothetical protein
MRRILPVVIGCVLLVIPGFAQRGGHAGGGGGGMRGGSGFSGGGMRGGGGVRSGGSFRGGGGYRGGGGFHRVGGSRGGYGFRGYYGYYPGFYGGFYDPYLWNYGGDYGDSGYAYPDYGATDYGATDYGATDYGGYTSYGPPAPSPQVLIISNQTPPQPMMVRPPPAPTVWNSGPNAQAKKHEDQLFLLAMKDGTIRAVVAYWVDGITVHYVTMDHEQKQTPLSSLDHSLSERLNRERNVTFSLPG